MSKHPELIIPVKKFRGYKIKVPIDATEAFTEKDYKAGLQYLKDVYNAEITETDKVIKD